MQETQESAIALLRETQSLDKSKTNSNWEGHCIGVGEQVLSIVYRIVWKHEINILQTVFNHEKYPFIWEVLHMRKLLCRVLILEL